MSREAIMELKNGRETDILVGEQVMGWQVETDSARLKRLDHYFSSSKNAKWWRKPDGGGDDILPPYSSDLTAAWQVVEQMNRRGQTVFILKTFEANQVAFNHPDVTSPDYVIEKTVAGAICKAALVAVLTR